MESPWIVWAEVVTPDDREHDTSQVVLIGLYSTRERADAARARAESFVRPDEHVEWTVEREPLDLVDWDTGFFDGTKE